MPVKFDDHEASGDDVVALDPETGFSPEEIHEATGIPRGSVETTLRRLEERDLVRRKEPYWAVDRRSIETYEAVLTSVRAVERSTTYDWGEADPADYRIGLDAVSEDSDGRA